MLVGGRPLPPPERVVGEEVGVGELAALVRKFSRVAVKVDRNVGINSGVSKGETILSNASVVPIVANMAAVAGAPGTMVETSSSMLPGTFVAPGVESPPKELLKTKAATAPNTTSRNITATAARSRGI